MKFICPSIFILFFFSCGRPIHKPVFNAFDFSIDAVFSDCFSIKFTQGDTVFIYQRFTRLSGLKKNTTYYSVLNNKAKNVIDSFVSNTNFSKFKHRYFQPIADGTQFQFYIENDTMSKTIFALGDSVPPQLNSFANWVFNLKSKLELVPIDTAVQFGSLKNFLIPEKNPPPIQFLPPGKK